MFPPADWNNPQWGTAEDEPHNWRSYASEELKTIWDTFTQEQKKTISACLDTIAQSEEWD